MPESIRPILRTNKPAVRELLLADISFLPGTEPCVCEVTERIAMSFREVAQIDAIRVRLAQTGDGVTTGFVLTVGRKRVLAARICGMTTVRAIVDDRSPEIIREIFLSSNLD